jgi:hypothetical protein
MRLLQMFRGLDGSRERATPESGGRALTPAERALGDFTISLRAVWPVLVLSVVVGAIGAGVALVLLDLIGMITHIAYDGTFGWSLIQPSLHHFGWLTIFVPVMAEHCIGALPVVTRDTKRLLGILNEFDLLKARQRQMTEEWHRERVLRLRHASVSASATAAAPKAASPGTAERDLSEADRTATVPGAEGPGGRSPP